MGLSHMAQLRRNKAVESENEDVHRRTRNKRKKEEKRAPAGADKLPSNKPPDPPPPMRDKAGTREAEQESSKGEHNSLMQPQPLADVHPFATTLHEWKNGIKVDCGPVWKWEDCEAAVERGPHHTATTPEAIDLLHTDIDYQQKAGFCRVFRWDELQRTRPPNLKISPVAVVPQVGRRGRIILDLSFPVYQKNNEGVTITQASVNDTTAKTGPEVPVKEIGMVLHRLLYFMKMTRAGVWIYFSKLDISDGFWRLVVRPEDSFNFAYVLPQKPGEPIRIVVPSALQMGWTQSPAYFCAATECARDLTQHLVDKKIDLRYHPIEELMTIPTVPPRARANSPTKLLQVYVDDFCNAATESSEGLHLAQIRRASIHGIHGIFPEPAVTNHKNGKDPISKGKLEKGDGNFETTKTLIGINFDGIKRTVCLPPDKANKYIREAHTMLRRATIPWKTFQKVIGKLRHAALILPATQGFFTPLNKVLKTPTKTISLNDDCKDAIRDTCNLIHRLTERPTHVNELLPSPPEYVAYHDASAEGAGGVWFSLSTDMQPLLWRIQFPRDITDSVISDKNPSGCITNSDLELAAEVLAVGIILSEAQAVKHKTLGTMCDNSPTVGWIDRMASRSMFPTAGRLLRGLAFMLHTCHTGQIITIHLPGEENVMADVASRPEKALAMFAPTQTHLSDADFRSSFDVAFPLPDKQEWALATVPEWLKSNVFETLRGKQLTLQQWTGSRDKNTGKRGRGTAQCTTRAAKENPLPMHAICSSPLLLPCGKASTASDVRSRFSQCPKLSAPSPKSTFWTDIETHDDPPTHSTPSTSL